jgi:hypothetical protein
MKNLITSVLLFFILFFNQAAAQNVAINADGSLPDASAAIDIASTTRGLLMPRMTTTQQNAISSPATGLLIFNTTDNVFKVNTGTPGSPVWTTLSASSNNWLLSGNSGTTGSNFIGTTDSRDFAFRTNNTQRMVINSAGNVGIGVTSPGSPLTVRDTLEIERVGSVSQLLFSNTAGSGDFRIGGDGGDIFWQGGGGRNLQMGAYWCVVLAGDRQTGTFPSFLPGVTNTGVLVQAQRDASVPLAIQPNSSSQTANLTEWRNSSGTAINVVNKNGNMAIGSSTFNSTNPEKFLVNAGTTTSVNAIVGKGSINSYLQLNIQNQSSGTSASSDVVATANNGDESSNFIDMGINGGSYTGGIMGSANDGYMYTMGNNFLIATGNANKSLVFMTGGTSQSTNERMRIDGTGNVGIGTTSPSQKLDISGNLRLSGAFMPGNAAGTSGYILQSNGSGTAPTWVDPGATAWKLGGNSLSSASNFGTTSNHDLPVITNNTEKMRISTTGDVAIGSSTFNSTNPEQLLVNAGTTTSVNAIVGKGSINSYLQLNIQNQSSGTSASSDVVATANNGDESSNFIDMGINGGSYTGGVMGSANDGYMYTMGNNFLIATGNANKSLVFMTGGTSQSTNERMRIDGSGNVGIGTTSANSTLTVSGSQSVSYRSGTGSYTVSSTDFVVINTGGGTPTFTLPAASSCAGRIYRLINHGTVSVTLSQSVTLANGSTSTSLSSASGSNTYEIVSDGSVWRKMN